MSVFTRVLAAFRGGGTSSAAHEAARDSMVARLSSAQRVGHAANLRAARPSIFRANRLNQIAAFYAEPANTIQVQVGDCAFLPDTRRQAARDMLAKLAGLPATGDSRHGAPAPTADTALRQTVLTRPVHDLNDRERAILRIAEMLRELGEINRQTELRLRLPIVWNKGGGQCRTAGFDSISRRSGLKTAIEMLLAEINTEPADGIAWLHRAWRNALSLDSLLGEDERQILESYRFVERGWLTASAEADQVHSSAALALGLFEDSRKELVYDSAASLITIAPPGSGKRATLLLRNLTHLAAGAVVLDLDGRAFHETARWRQTAVGKIFAFAPALPAHSMHYNPLDAIPTDPTAGWAEAQQLAALLVATSDDSHGDRRTRAFIAPAVLDVALNEPDGGRDMQAVLARLLCSGGPLADWTESLSRSPHAPLRQHGERLRALPDHEREALLRQIGPQLDVWRSPAIAQLTDRSDWTPDDLRRHGSTLYLCVNRADLARFAPIIRVILHQTMAALGGEKTVSPDATVTFFIDEASRIGPIDIVEQMIHSGGEVGVRPWLFFADDADMRSVYPDADAMIANCGAQCYIDPDPATAQELSLRLGHCKSLFGTDQRPLATADELTGPAFAGRTVAIIRGLPPAKLLALDAGPPGQHPEQATRH